MACRPHPSPKSRSVGAREALRLPRGCPRAAQISGALKPIDQCIAETKSSIASKQAADPMLNPLANPLYEKKQKSGGGGCLVM